MQLLYRSLPLPKGRQVSFPVFIFFALALIAIFAELSRYSINNYLIFKQVFWHTIHQTNLYTAYPLEHEDTNHYGPFFSVIIAPFAVLPTALGATGWVLFNTAFLFFALHQLPVSPRAKATLLLLVALENMTASHNEQSNTLLAAWIILSYTYVQKDKPFWAALFVVMGTLVKLYGVVGLVFFLFTKRKGQYLLGLLFWTLVCFCAPMVLGSPQFIVQSYQDWYHSLVFKNTLNTELKFANMQDISFPGMIRRIFRIADLPSLVVLAPAGVLAALPLLRTRLYGNTAFQMQYLAMILIAVVIYSSSAESATYIIALCGVGIWVVLNQHRFTNREWALLAFVMVLTCLSPTDLFPKNFKQAYITHYALKALPCVLVWFVLIAKLFLAPVSHFQPMQRYEN